MPKKAKPKFDLNPVEKACATIAIALEPYIADQTAEEYLPLLDRNRVERGIGLLFDTLELDNVIDYDRISDAMYDGFDYKEDL
jgi:hypothetical protein|tara:strand:+ start:1349 stop:1597 length:249 start_codon:yes stop_codon:yes gene_type:complete